MGAQQSSATRNAKKWLSDFEILQLLDEETKMSFAPVSTISFFDCDESNLQSVEAWITDRVTQIATANRWIMGRLVHATDTGRKRKSLAVPHSLAQKDLDRLLIKNPENFRPSRSMSPEQLSAQYVNIQLPYKSSAYDKEDVFVCRFVFARTPEGFCIVFSMSHTVGDGHTFYKIMNQLSAEENVQALQPKRKLDFSQNVKTVLETNADDEMGLRFKLSMGLSVVGTLLKRTFARRKTRMFSGLIDAEKIAQVKTDAASKGTVPFVSTNDIITSAFSNAAGADTCVMAINLRERMSGLTECHAGNYIDTMMFDGANASTPDRIRLALTHPRFHCRDEPMKTFSRWCMITNWTSFSKPIRIPDCAEQLHQPVFDVRELKYLPIDFMIVFRAGGGRLGAYWIIPRGGSEQDVLGDMPFAEDTLKCSVF